MKRIRIAFSRAEREEIEQAFGCDLETVIEAVAMDGPAAFSKKDKHADGSEIQDSGLQSGEIDNQ
ncbi:MAG: hypothetical protein AAFX93_13995 [Verrucomicrobiota bacterium]